MPPKGPASQNGFFVVIAIPAVDQGEQMDITAVARASGLTRKAASTSLVARVKADPYVVSHSTPEWTADGHPELVRAEVGR
jgi:hypothetical protein